MKKAVITGGMGFVGRRLADRLIEKGYTVKIFSRSGGAGPGGRAVPEVTRVDYRDSDGLAKELSGADIVFHLAAAIFAFNKEEFEAANVEVTKNMAEAAAKAGVGRFVYLSSQAAAGPSRYKNNPRTEADAPAPVSDYGATKLTAEEFVNKLPAVMHKAVLRAPVVYGRHDSGVSKIAAWVKRGFMVNAGSGGTFFNFVYIDDLVAALCTAAEDPRANGQTFFVCESASYSWKYFINAMARAMGSPAPLLLPLPYFMLEVIAFLYEAAARIFGFAPALNYDKIKEARIKGHWTCSPQKWIDLTGQTFTALDYGLKESFK
jgi:nucleoside-diphosphate-sugar epimerase